MLSEWAWGYPPWTPCTLRLPPCCLEAPVIDKNWKPLPDVLGYVLLVDDELKRPPPYISFKFFIFVTTGAVGPMFLDPTFP